MKITLGLVVASILCLLTHWLDQSHAQYIQDYQVLNPGGVPTVYWRRTTNNALTEVIVPASPIAIEYNCHYMPATCQNALVWINRPINPPQGTLGRSRRLAMWAGSPNVFAYDLKTAAKEHRGDRMCSSRWKDTHSCPEMSVAIPPLLSVVIQPPIMPDNWMPNTRETLDPIQVNEIAAQTKPDPNFPTDPSKNITVRRSGRYYTCEEFPPRSWVEGGVGTPGQNVSPELDGFRGETICAPMMMNLQCNGGADDEGVWSEQNWQGGLHTQLQLWIKRAARARLGVDPDPEIHVVVFNLLLVNNGPNGVPGSVRYHAPVPESWDVGLDRPLPDKRDDGPPIGKIRPSGVEMLKYFGSLRSEDYLESVNIPLYKNQTISDLADDDTNHTPLEDEPSSLSSSGFNMVANSTSDSDSSSTTSDLPTATLDYTLADAVNSTAQGVTVTQQQPGLGHPDILQLGTEYILGQLGTVSNDTASNSSLSLLGRNTTTTAQPLPRYLNKDQLRERTQMTPFSSLNKRVDGPIQCSATQECLDGSCCSADGKCGFKEVHCGTGCQSHCEAKAMCGIDSADGKTSCGLKLCCSYYGWCGTESVHCLDPEPLVGKTPCQQGFGGCKIIPPPSCDKRSGSSRGRRIAYWQGWNVRERTCDTVTPNQINTRGLTHLFYAFISFDPATFQIAPRNTLDIPVYGQFTALKRNGLQTWVAVGGWSFNDPGTPTEFAYSNMVSTAANRAAFIKSLIAFMELYGFQGADLDWEYPAEPKRGGRSADTDNLTLLMKEAHAAFAGRFGLSLTIAPDYWYLRGFKPVEIEPYVDFMGFMAYDLHGPWDSDVKTLGPKVRPQTDITEIERDLLPLWFDGVDPRKVVMGIAYYGRTYKLTDSSCGSMGCPFSGTGAPGRCTKTPGVLSNREIRQMIQENGYKPYTNTTAMVKYFTYGGDNWVGYDDEDTYAMKELYADSRCLGGIMIWSIDFDATVGGGGGLNNCTSPESATVIPMAHTTVAPKATFTVTNPIATDINQLPPGTKQNVGQCPSQNCLSCSFFRLITSTCCGFGGSTGNPIVIPANVPVPMDIPLPAGFVPNQPFVSPDGKTHPAGVPLPTETILPGGTIFTAPFVIPPGQPLRNGESDDKNGNGTLVWVDPSIWKSPNPEVQCFWPCVLVLPPWPKTTTIDYPLVTVTSGTWKSTITHKPLTVSSWYISTIVVSSKSSNDGTKKRTSVVIPVMTKTWPPIIYTDPSGAKHTTRPPGPMPPPPPAVTGPIPPILIVNGTPKPTTRPWPDPCCPPGLPEEPNEEEEDPEDPNPVCILRPDDPETEDPDPGNPAPTPTAPNEPDPAPTPTTSIAPLPPAPTAQNPNFSKDFVSCYDAGQSVTSERLSGVVSSFCKVNFFEGYTLEYTNSIMSSSFSSGWKEPNGAGVTTLVSLEIKPGCQWQITEDSCNSEFKKIVDGCNKSATKASQGGIMENDCVKYRLDPDANAPPPPPAPPPTDPPAPPPKPTGAVCLSVGAFDFQDGSNSAFEALLDKRDLCGDKGQTLDAVDPCVAARNREKIKMCGKEVFFQTVDGENFDKFDCRMALNVDGSVYDATLLDPYASDNPCGITCTKGVYFGSYTGHLHFPNVPLCD